MPSSVEERVEAACSFCLKPSSAVNKLVAGAGVYICNECVGLCVMILDSNPEGSRLALWEQVNKVEDVLAHLPRVAAASDQVERDLAAWVRRARQLGATWAQVGQALGMARQSAWERFSGEE